MALTEQQIRQITDEIVRSLTKSMKEEAPAAPPFARVKISPAVSAAAVGWSMRAHTPIFGR